MRAKLLGVQALNFRNNEGEQISGTNIFCSFADENVQGMKVGKFFLKEGVLLPKDTKLNDDLELSFNMKGKVDK